MVKFQIRIYVCGVSVDGNCYLFIIKYCMCLSIYMFTTSILYFYLNYLWERVLNLKLPSHFPLNLSRLKGQWDGKFTLPVVYLALLFMCIFFLFRGFSTTRHNVVQRKNYSCYRWVSQWRQNLHQYFNKEWIWNCKWFNKKND